MKNVKTIDLFAGIGGVRLAFEKAGFKTIFANDFDKKCAITYDLNFSDIKLTIKDIREINPEELPNFDLLLGGFPCQPFSIAGYRKGMDDERGTLFFEIAKIIEQKKPVGIFLENVKNIVSHNGGKTFQLIIDKLDSLGYDVQYKVLNSMDYGDVPQNRERVYIVCFLKNTGIMKNFSFPNKLNRTKTIRDILENKIDDEYYYKDKPLFNKIKDFPFKKGVIYQWRHSYIRENKSEVCPTLTANMGTGGHNVPLIFDDNGIRKLTPRECASIQGFPFNYKFPNIAKGNLYKQIGNSVSVPVVYRIAKNIMKVMPN